MPSNWMPLSNQSQLFFSDKNDKDEGKTPKGFEKFFKKKQERDAEKSTSADTESKGK
jgi:hypothetical protein